MSEILGTIIAAQITSGDDSNTWSLGDLNFFQGGHHCAGTLAQRDAITAARRHEGMTCYVAETQQVFRLVGGTDNANWTVDGVPTSLVMVADSALAGADFAIYLASQGTNGVNQLWPIAMAGTNLAYAALTTAWNGTNAGNTAISLASTGTTLSNLAITWIGTLNSNPMIDAGARAGVAQIQAIANSGTNGANSALFIATQGTNGANFGIWLASSGTAGVNQLYPIATAGTTVANLAVQWIGTLNSLVGGGGVVDPSARAGVSQVLAIATTGTAVAYAALTAAWAGTIEGRTLLLCSAYTPVLTGPDLAELPVPYSASNGTSSKTYNIRRLGLTVQTAGTVSSVAIEKSYVASGGFTAISVGTIALSAGNYDAATVSSLGTINSGDKLRFNPLILGTAQNWAVTVEIGT